MDGAREGRVPLGRYAARVGRDRLLATLSDVGYSFDGGATWALEGVSLSVGARERLCLMGANGSGKSTLALLLAALRAPDEGTVELKGKVCFAEGVPEPDAYRAARRSTGLVFQDPDDQIVAGMVADDVAFGPENLALDPAEIGRRVERELDRVHALDLAPADPAELSGGQLQRVAIAGAMAMEPALMVFDEASAFLDVRGRSALARVRGRLADVCAQVWVSHAPEDAEEADRLVVLERGRVAFDGPPAELLADAPRMRSLGLEPPFRLRLFEALRSRGWELCPPGSDDELACSIARILAKGGGVSRPVRASRGAKASAPSGDAAVFEARDLGFSYGATPVLAGIDLSVRPGELVAVVGATGSGKSTLARLLAGLAEPSTGVLRFCGADLATRAGRRAASGRIGFVMQRPERQLFAETLAKDVAFGPENLGLPGVEVEARVEGALGRLGIAELADRSPFELSGGQQRLAALAGVLALDPEAWILDEPTAGLDAEAAARVDALITELGAEGRPVILITHAMERAAAADRVVVLADGRVGLAGTPAEVFSHARELEAAGLGLPAPLVFARRLRELGADVGDPLTFEALVDALGEVGCS